MMITNFFAQSERYSQPVQLRAQDGHIQNSSKNFRSYSKKFKAPKAPEANFKLFIYLKASEKCSASPSHKVDERGLINSDI